MRFSVLLIATLCFVLAESTTTQKPAAPASHHVTKAADHHHASHQAAKAHVVSDAHGNSAADEKHASHKAVKKIAKKSKHDEETARKGNHEVVNHKVQDAEHGGKKTKNHDSDHHSSHKKAGGHSEHGAKFQDAAKHKKNSVSKGFRELYHKNEHKKHDSFYDNSHKSGDWKTFSSKKANHHGHKVEVDDHTKHVSVKALDKHGKQGKKVGGHSSSDEKGHKSSSGKKTAFEHQDKWSKKAQQKQHDKHKYKYVPVAEQH